MSLTVRGVPLSRHVKLRRAEYRRRFLRPTHHVSFYAEMDRRRQYWDRLVDIHGDDTELYPEFSKLRARELGVRAGVDVPRLLDGPISVDDLRLDEYGDDFVIKPNWGKTTRGVLVLHRVGDGEFINAIDGAKLDASGIRPRVEAGIAASARGDVDDLIVEQSLAVGGRRPYEWKVFAFYGEVGFIQANAHRAGRVVSKLYSPEWTDLGRVRKDRILDETIELPQDPERILAAAKAISKEVPTGFIRVDLFDGPTGPVLGEVCLIPGGDHFYRRGLDRRLGQMWFDANARILAEKKPLIP